MAIKSYNMGLPRTVRAAVVRHGIQQLFARRLQKSGSGVQKIVIASPWISSSGTLNPPLPRIIRIINKRRIPTYVFTRPPESESHSLAVDSLAACSTVELVYNQNLHAKAYTCLGPYPFGFAVLGSANMTGRSDELYEIGLIVLAGGGGDEIVRQIAAFGLDYLRTRPDSLLIKRMTTWR